MQYIFRAALSFGRLSERKIENTTHLNIFFFSSLDKEMNILLEENESNSLEMENATAKIEREEKVSNHSGSEIRSK